MNLYITDISLRKSAINLDVVRLRKQWAYAVDIAIQAILLDKKLYYPVIDRAQKNYVLYDKAQKNYVLYDNRMKELEKWEAKGQEVVNGAVKWTAQSPAHLLFVLFFIEELRAVRRRGGVYSTPIEYREKSQLLDIVKAYLQQIMPSPRGVERVLQSSLYKNVPDTITETTTISAYRQHLLSQWKQDVAKEEAWIKEYALWKADGTRPKPRKPTFLYWEMQGRTRPPDWARESLTEFRKSLNNAL